MNNISPIGRPSAAPAVNASQAEVRPRETAQHRGRDQVELSTAARMLSRLQQLPDVREDVVDRVRSQIADGTYETDEKLETAINELGEDVL